jgi:hypothetical protein
MMPSAEFIRKGKELAVPFDFKFREIDDVLSLNNSKFDVCVDDSYHFELNIKVTKGTDSATPYLEYTYNLTMMAD